MAEVLKTILLLSCTGTFFVAFLMLLRPVTQKLFSAGWHYYMWLAVLLVMVLPVRIHLPVRENNVPFVTEVTTEHKDVILMPEEKVQPAEITYVPEEAIRQTKVEKEKNYSINWSLCFNIWGTVATLMLMGKILNYALFLIRVRLRSSEVSCPTLTQYTKRKVRVRLCQNVSSPLMLGVFRPVLLLPQVELTEAQLHYILAHECTHLKRQDILYKWFLCFVKCVHWFNPVVYFMARQIHLDCESSCDMAVVHNMNPAETKSYMETILSLLTAEKTREIPLTTGMTGQKKVLVKRFRAMTAKMKISKQKVIISAVLAFVIIMSAFFISAVLNGKIHFLKDEILPIRTDMRQGAEFNILLIGVDKSQHADAILVVNYDGETITGLSIPRNTSFSSGAERGRMSDLLAKENGDQLAVDALRGFGIPIHYYAKVEMKAVETLIDNAGGLDFEIPYQMVYDDPHQDLHIALSKGQQRLNGEQVMQLLRYRGGANGEEERRITWFSVIKAFVKQIVLEGRLEQVEGLYELLQENVTTNYPLKDLLKDIKQLEKLDRNHMVFKNLPGQNVVTPEGYLEYQINHEKAEGVWQLFKGGSAHAELVETFPYENREMGFRLQLPLSWKGNISIVTLGSEVTFFHKEIYSKYGQGHGKLFTVQKLVPPTEERPDTMESEPEDLLYWSKDYKFVWSIASDVQYPAWDDRTAEDARLAEEFEDMMLDLLFIKQNFSVLETQQAQENVAEKQEPQGNAEEVGVFDETIQVEKRVHPISGAVKEEIVTVPTSETSIFENTSTGAREEERPPSNKKDPLTTPVPPMIKSKEKSDIPYGGFEHLVLENTNMEAMQRQLARNGVAPSGQDAVNLDDSYIINNYRYEDDLQYENTDITCDANGNISVYFEVNSDNLVDISFYDSDTKENVGSYLVLANNKNAYSFLGFDKEKTYDISISGKTGGTWEIDGQYLIY